MSKVLKLKVKGFKIIDVKADDVAGIVEAYVSIFGNVDLAGEVVDKGAFAESLGKKLPKMVWSHDWEQPIGTTLEAREDEKGLYIKAQLVKGVQKAEEAIALMLAGAIDEFSIGYSVQEDYIGDDGFRHLKKLRLYEYSPVLVGANQETELLSVKGADGKFMQTGKGLEKEIPDEETEPEVKAPAEGDTCTMPDGSEGEMHPNDEGEMVCMAKKAKEIEPKPADAPAAADELKEGRVLSSSNRVLVEQVVENADNLAKSLKALVNPLKELLSATENTGGKVEPKPENDIKVIRVRQAIKQADDALGFALRIIK